jgi:transposase
VLPTTSLHLPRNPGERRQIAIKLLDSFHTCPIPEVARLGRTLRAWKGHILAHFDTHGVSNGGTEAITLIIEKVRRLAHGFKDFDHYRLRIMLAADGRRPYETRPNHA